MNEGATLLRARELRVDVAGTVAIERASFDARGPRIVLVGETHGILAALAGRGRIRGGSLHVGGFDVAGGEHMASVGLAPHDPPLDPAWTGVEFVAWGARLSGMPKARARAVAQATLNELALSELANAKVGALGIVYRRALVLAQAVVHAPKVLVAASPLAGLDDSSAAALQRVLALAQRGRASIIGLSTPWHALEAGSAEHGLAAAADDVLVLTTSGLIQHGTLAALSADAGGYLVTVRQNAATFVAALAARGAQCQGGPARFWVRLPPPLSEKDLFTVSLETGAPLVELRQIRSPVPPNEAAGPPFSPSVVEVGPGSP